MHNPKFNDHLEHPVTKRLLAPGPKRILALDGGGIRGALSLGFLEKIENILRERYDNPKFTLSEYFDLIGGTSTGSIIAASLALGREVSYIKEKYIDLGGKIFGKKRKPLIPGPFRYFLKANYDAGILENELRSEYGDITLGSEKLKTGLCIVTRRADTFSTWVFHNHPRGAYYELNKGVYLRDLTRASSAAPSYFEPMELDVGNNEIGIFIDGGVSSSNNPALLMLLMANLRGYPFHWKLGEENIFIVSIGTGFARPKVELVQKAKLKTKRSIFWAKDIPDLFMTDATFLNQMILQYFSDPMIPERINAESGEMKFDLLTENPVISYVRYNTLLQKGDLSSLGFHYDLEELEEIQRMDNGNNAEKLYQIGKKSAEIKVKEKHFTPSFDYRIVDRNTDPVSQVDLQKHFFPILKSEGSLYKKYRPVLARQAKSEEKIISITSDGEETFSTALPGDYIVQNQTKFKEQYIVKKDKFDARYERLRDGKEGWTEYKPIGEVYGIQLDQKTMEDANLSQHFFLEAPWGEKQYCTKGDFLVSPPTFDEIYRIGKEEFEETYILGDKT